jgi:hypothetical protein
MLLSLLNASLVSEALPSLFAIPVNPRISLCMSLCMSLRMSICTKVLNESSVHDFVNGMDKSLVMGLCCSSSVDTVNTFDTVSTQSRESSQEKENSIL